MDFNEVIILISAKTIHYRILMYALIHVWRKIPEQFRLNQSKWNQTYSDSWSSSILQIAASWAILFGKSVFDESPEEKKRKGLDIRCRAIQKHTPQYYPRMKKRFVCSPRELLTGLLGAE